jgi:hypothetical protein
MVRISKNIQTKVKIGLSPSPPGPPPSPPGPPPSPPGPPPSNGHKSSSKKSDSGLIIGITVGSIMSILVGILIYNKYYK